MVEWTAATHSLIEAIDKAVERSMRQGAFMEKKSIRANIEGAPRWGMDNHSPAPRGGGPGIKTGRLQRSVRYMPIVKEGYGRYMTTIRASRIYAAKVERAYPYFKPGIVEVLPEVRENFIRNYRQALSKL